MTDETTRTLGIYYIRLYGDHGFISSGETFTSQDEAEAKARESLATGKFRGAAIWSHRKEVARLYPPEQNAGEES